MSHASPKGGYRKYSVMTNTLFKNKINYDLLIAKQSEKELPGKYFYLSQLR